MRRVLSFVFLKRAEDAFVLVVVELLVELLVVHTCLHLGTTCWWRRSLLGVLLLVVQKLVMLVLYPFTYYKAFVLLFRSRGMRVFAWYWYYS